MISTGCINVCGCASYCMWANCNLIYGLVHRRYGSGGLEQVLSCSGCPKGAMCGDIYNASSTQWCNYNVHLVEGTLGASLPDPTAARMRRSKCASVYRNDILLGIISFMITCLVVATIGFYRHQRSLRCASVIVAPTPNTYDPEDDEEKGDKQSNDGDDEQSDDGDKSTVHTQVV